LDDAALASAEKGERISEAAVVRTVAFMQRSLVAGRTQ
jgi:creatinine amidohydrolase/Fe(II)-dependent formamide hydrolase-like protein